MILNHTLQGRRSTAKTLKIIVGHWRWHAHQNFNPARNISTMHTTTSANTHNHHQTVPSQSLPSTPLRQMYKLRQSIMYIYSQAEKDMELDHKDHPLTLQNWKLQSSNFMKFVLFLTKKEVNSYPMVQDEKNAVEQFLNIKVQNAMCCLETQESSNNPSTIPDEVPTENISNPHDQTVVQVPQAYQASKHEHSTPLSEITTNLTFLQAKHEFLVDRGANGDLAGSYVILLSRFDREPHPLDNMDYSINPIERSQFGPYYDELVEYINRTIQTPPSPFFF